MPPRVLLGATNNQIRRASLENLVETAVLYNDPRASQELRARLVRAIANFRKHENNAHNLLRLSIAVRRAGVNLTKKEEGAVRALFGLHYARS